MKTKIAIACQRGGSQTPFTAGVLKALCEAHLQDERRAGDVVTYLVSQGVNPNIISAKGFGDAHPVAPNDTPADRAKNRRIEIAVQGPGAPGA
jgi:hypothetical protein